MVYKIFLSVISGMLFILIAACQSVRGAAPTSSIKAQNSTGAEDFRAPIHRQQDMQTTPTPVLLVTADPKNPYLKDDNVVKSAINDLAKRLRINPDEIELVSIVYEDLPAGSLGCPLLQKNQGKIPALVHGKIILLRWNGQEYEYHSHAGQVVFCSPAILPGTLMPSP
jgi:hypothetical protein